ncbi:MAG: SAM-dependent methyltransferase [Deltaproteobacteria bacterium]|nr:SAM-dependent methyltransferase [Deltaproteobacteria bacterium]
MKRNTTRCIECGRIVTSDKSCIVDCNVICFSCMYGNEKPCEIYPIGIIHNKLGISKRDFGVVGPKGISCIDLLPSQKKFMYRLDEEEQLTIIYYLHNVKSVKSVFKRGLDGKEVGVFASRTARRLSRIGIQDVTLVSIEDTRLIVRGLDAIDGTPVLDIKIKWNAS